jgi:glycosyltransferase involved in cell wall biosynthesis
LLLPAADAIVVTGAPEREALRRSPAFASRTRLIPLSPTLEPHAPPSAERNASLRAELGFPREAVVVAFFGFIHPVKRLADLLTAVATVRPRHPELRLLVVGGWDPLSLTAAEVAAQRMALEGLVDQLQLGDAVRFAGHVAPDRASALLSSADLAALPLSYGVGPKSGSLLALLAHGLPTIATAPRDADQRSTEDVPIVSVPPRDPAALAGAIKRLVEDPALRGRLAAAARRFGRSRSWAATAAAHEMLYASLVGPGRISRATEDAGVGRATG